MGDHPANASRQGIGLRKALEILSETEWMKYEDARRQISKVYPPGQAAHHAEYMQFSSWRTRLPEDQRNKVTMSDMPTIRRTTTQLIERGAEALAYEVLRNPRFEKQTDENGVMWVKIKRGRGLGYKTTKKKPPPLTAEQRSVRAQKAAQTRRERGTQRLAGAAAISGEARSEMGRRSHLTRLNNIRGKIKEELRSDPEFMAEIKAQLRAEIEQEVERQRAAAHPPGHD